MRPSARRLPKSLPEALDALENEPLFRGQLGDIFVDYFLKLKRNEAGRFQKFLEDSGTPASRTSRPPGSRTNISISSEASADCCNVSASTRAQ